MIAKALDTFRVRVNGDGGCWRASEHVYIGNEYRVKRVNRKTVTIFHEGYHNNWEARVPIEKVELISDFAYIKRELTEIVSLGYNIGEAFSMLSESEFVCQEILHKYAEEVGVHYE